MLNPHNEAKWKKNGNNFQNCPSNRNFCSPYKISETSQQKSRKCVFWPFLNRHQKCRPQYGQSRGTMQRRRSCLNSCSIHQCFAHGCGICPAPCEICVISWSTRTFDTVLHRIEVLKCFGLSRVYYVASVLPMKARWMKSFNQVMGDFLWRKSGKVLKLPMDEIVNSFGRGGLGLPSIEAMNKSLILTQMFRLMKSDDEKSKMHLNMWLGPVLSDIWVGPAVVDGGMNYEHFNMVAEIVVEAKLHQHINIEVWPILTNKLVYAGFAENFAKTKVERESMQSMDLVWSRLKSLELDRNVQETSFLLVHDKLPVKERVYRIGLARDPYCDSCDAAVFGDTQHYFTQCGQVNTSWRWVRTVLHLIMGAQADIITDKELLNFSWASSRFDREVVWLISWFVWFRWRNFENDGSNTINGRELFGFMRFKYREALHKKLLSPIPGLL